MRIGLNVSMLVGFRGDAVPSLPSIMMPQEFGVSVSAQALDALTMPQGFAAEIVADDGAAPWSPADMPLTMDMWIDGSDAATVTSSGGLASAWANKSGGAGFTQSGLDTIKPLYEPAAGPNGTGWLRSDGARWMTSTWNPASPPGTQPLFIWAVVTVITGIASGNVWCGNAAGQLSFVTTSTGGSCRLANGANGGTVTNGLPPGVSKRVEAYFANNIAADYLTVGAQTSSGVLLGNNDPSSFNIMSRNSGLGPIAVAISEMVIYRGLPSSPNLALLNAYGSNKYGAGVLA